MPPKKKNNKPAAKKDKTPKTGLSAKAVASQLKEEYEGKIKTLNEQLEENSTSANMANMKFTQALNFVEVTQSHLDDLDKNYRDVYKLLEEKLDSHLEEREIWRQNMRSALQRANEKYAALKTFVAEKRINLISQFEDELQVYRRDNQQLKTKIRDMDVQHYDYVKSLVASHNEEKSRMEQEFIARIELIEVKRKADFTHLQNESNLMKETALNEVEDRNNLQIRTLMAKHEAQFANMKKYFNDITSKSVKAIKDLKDELSHHEMNIAGMNRKEAAMNNEIANLKSWGEKMEKEKNKLEKYHQMYNTERINNTRKVVDVKTLESENNRLKKNLIVMEERLRMADEFQKNVDQAILKAQEQVGLRNCFLEKKISVLENDLEIKDCQLVILADALQAERFDSSIIDITKKNIEDVINQKNLVIHNLKLEFAKRPPQTDQKPLTADSILSALDLNV